MLATIREALIISEYNFNRLHDKKATKYLRALRSLEPGQTSRNPGTANYIGLSPDLPLRLSWL